jgi:hypothetical protein
MAAGKEGCLDEKMLKGECLRRLAAILVALALCCCGLGVGEGEEPPWLMPWLGIAVLVLGPLLIAALYPGAYWTKIVVAVVFLGLYVAAYVQGKRAFNFAFNECVDKGHEVRLLLKAYHDKNGAYPDGLDQLNAPLTCSRLIRGTILKYNTKDNGYVLVFKDWLVEFSSSDVDGFSAYK